MANEEQLAILRQGVEVWNQWRIKNPYINPNLKRADLKNMDLSHANLFRSKLIEANLENCNLFFSDLRESSLRKSNIQGAKLIGADLRGSWLSEADLRRTDLVGAVLGGQLVTHELPDDLEEDVSRHSLDNTNIGNCMVGYTTWLGLDLSNTKGLETLEHLGPSTLGTDTIQFSGGKLPTLFLRGCGLSDLEIEFAKLANPSLDPGQVTDITYNIHQLYIGKGVQYFSCFISYNSKDKEFAKELHNDLQNYGVRCWFAPEDMKIGDQIRPRIDQEIRLRDKLLVILSENSVKSEWVGDEVEAALEEESKSNRLVLFPIRLDDTVMSTRDDWAAKIKRRRHIGDFSNWKDKASYQKAFERLLKDLKATGGEVYGE